ncbi:MAG: putative ATP-dependent RNA helicase DHR1 [Candelina submexicana]|nr:MAG: putative ATP-dependent RNA helicase DHR1 [Candelina submexicana]
MPRFVPRQRKHKVLQRQQRHGVPTAPLGDSNAAEILPVSKSEKEEKRRRLKEELRAQQPKISSKKQKRLDKYIDTKLKKEENLELIKKLAQTRVDTSLFRSSKSLGVSKESKREVLSRALREQQAGVNIERNEGFLLEERQTVQYNSEESSSEGDEDHDATATGTAPQTPAKLLSVGSGLKRPLEVGDDGNPVIKKRRRAKKPPKLNIAQEPSWDGFISTDSEGGTSHHDPHGSNSDVESIDSEGLESDTSSQFSVSPITSNDQAVDTSTMTDEYEVEDEADDDRQDTKQRSSAFKAWATQQHNNALGFVPSSIFQSNGTGGLAFTPRAPEREPLPPELATNTATDLTRKAFSVPIERSREIQEGRLGLPVVAEEQKIMEAIHNSPTVVIWGATGSGKTTQVPQFLYEAGYGNPDGPTPGMIGITQPRRVAAVSMAKRVAQELGPASERVAYQIRFERTVSEKTAVKFMTDGVLLREIAEDLLLIKYSTIIIDEAHERSVNTDILIGMMSRIVDERTRMSKADPNIKPLKLIIMSATLRISDFTKNNKLFRNGPPPLLKTEGRQHPVTVHFARRTQRDYVEEAFHKVTKGHRKLPPGGMLVFLTGQSEISVLSKRLEQAFTSTEGSHHKRPPMRVSGNEISMETEDLEIGDVDDLDMYGDVDEVDGLQHDDEEDDQDLAIDDDTEGPPAIHVLPLYSQLPTDQQLRVFEPPPGYSRLIVLATNVAETSLTIPGIRFVFDCGRAKERKYDDNTGVQSFEVGWISKASASQRAGRAGRTGPGHCYRLYSSAVYERDFEEHTEPEILRTPIEGVVLQLKGMNLQNVVNFPFPTPPDQQRLVKAEKLLSYLGALSLDGEITNSGAAMSIYPLSPRFSRMLLIGHQHDCMPYTIALVAALAVSDLFIPENQLDLAPSPLDEQQLYTNADRIEDTARENRRKAYIHALNLFSRRDRTSDALRALTALCAYAYSSDPHEFCASMFLRPKTLLEASKLRHQLTTIVRANRPGVIGSYEARLKEPSDAQLKALRQIVAAGFIDQVAIRADLSPTPLNLTRKPKRAIDVPYLTLFPSHIRGPSSTPEEAEDSAVYLSPSSILSSHPTSSLPQYIIYSHLQQRSPATPPSTKPPKIRMYPLTPISGLQLSSLAQNTPLLEYSKPIGKITALQGISPEKRECWVVPNLVGGAEMRGWPLSAKRVLQRREGARGGWVVEKIL